METKYLDVGVPKQRLLKIRLVCFCTLGASVIELGN